MNKPNNNKSAILVVAGCFLIAISQSITQLTDLPDLAKGVLTGIGIGLLFLAIFNKHKIAQ